MMCNVMIGYYFNDLSCDPTMIVYPFVACTIRMYIHMYVSCNSS